MRRSIVSGLRVGLLSLLAGVILPAAVAAQEERAGALAAVKFGDDAIIFEPLVEFEELALTVSGPGLPLTRLYKERPVLKVTELGPRGAADGNYRYELRLAPKIDPEIRKRLARLRASGDDRAVDELRRRGLLPAGPSVQSGSFTVVEGQIVDWRKREERSGRSPQLEGTLQIAGDLEVKGAKRFRMADPVDGGREILFAALEGPEVGTYFRGSARLDEGMAVVELPESFSRVTEEDQLTVQLTPVGGWARLYVVDLSRRRLVVRDADGGDAVRFDFLVQGIRRGYADAETERPLDADER